MNNPHFEPAAIVWAQVWQVTLVALVLGLAARFGCRRRPHLAYLLWMLVVLKALTPPLVASPTGLFSWALRELNRLLPMFPNHFRSSGNLHCRDRYPSHSYPTSQLHSSLGRGPHRRRRNLSLCHVCR